MISKICSVSTKFMFAALMVSFATNSWGAPPEVYAYGCNPQKPRSNPNEFLRSILDLESNLKKQEKSPSEATIIFDLDGTMTDRTDPVEVQGTKPRGDMPLIAKYLHDLGFKVVISSGWDKFNETVARINKIGMGWIFNGETAPSEMYLPLGKLLKPNTIIGDASVANYHYLRIVSQGNAISCQYVEKQPDESYVSVHCNNKGPIPFFRAKWMVPEVLRMLASLLNIDYETHKYLIFADDQLHSVEAFHNKIQNTKGYENIKSLDLFAFSNINGVELEGDRVSDNQEVFHNWLRKQHISPTNDMIDINKMQQQKKINNNNNLNDSLERVMENGPPVPRDFLTKTPSDLDSSYEESPKEELARSFGPQPNTSNYSKLPSKKTEDFFIGSPPFKNSTSEGKKSFESLPRSSDRHSQGFDPRTTSSANQNSQISFSESEYSECESDSEKSETPSSDSEQLNDNSGEHDEECGVFGKMD